MFKLDFKALLQRDTTDKRKRPAIEISGWLVAVEARAAIFEGFEPRPTFYTLETCGDEPEEAYEMAVLTAMDASGRELWQSGALEFSAREEVWVKDAIHKAWIGRKDV